MPCKESRVVSGPGAGAHPRLRSTGRHEPPVRQADVPAVPDDDVVPHRDAEQALCARAVDVVLIDVRLGSADGMDLIEDGVSGRLVNVRNGRYDHVPIDVVASRKKVVDVGKFYNIQRLRPQYKRFAGSPVFIMTSDY